MHLGQRQVNVRSAMAGDTTRNLLWRLQNGEGPGKVSPKVAVVLIGTNDITNPMYNLVRILMQCLLRSLLVDSIGGAFSENVVIHRTSMIRCKQVP